MTDMIERVARALCKARFLDGGNRDDGWDECPEGLKCEYRKEARAAIEAMRELTWEMTFTPYGDPMPPNMVWTYMIEGALGERGK